MRERWDDAEVDPMAALRDGDPDPFERFVALETASLLGFFRRLGAPLEEAEDLTQDTLVKLYRSAPRYASRERFSAYVFRVARNAWIDAERRRAVRPERSAGYGEESGPETHLTDGGPSADARAEGREQAGRLERALGGLPEGQRMVFELGVLQELPYEAISGLLEIPVGTVKSRMFHAVRRLRALLGESEEGAAQ